MMRQHVRLVAVLAGIGSLPGVGNQVAGQFGSGGKASLAMLTGEGKIGGVDCLKVDIIVSRGNPKYACQPTS